MGAENGDQLGRDGHAAGFVGGTVFESAFVVGASLVAFFPASFATAFVPAAAAPAPGIMAIPISPAMPPTVMAAPATLIAVT